VSASAARAIHARTCDRNPSRAHSSGSLDAEIATNVRSPRACQI